MSEEILTEWRPEWTRMWGREPMCLPHRLHTSPLFSLESLASLIERYPAEHYALVLTSKGAGDARRWREGSIAGASGRAVIETISRGSMWLNLRQVATVDSRYARLLEGIYQEFASHLPGFEPTSLNMGILISSPMARVHYHADLPGQSLWQIRGSKRVYLYPNRPPFLTAEAIEDIAYAGLEFKLGYDPEFDSHAHVHDLVPGQMLTWPLNAPHRIENHDCVNISVTTEHWTDEIRRSQQVNMANAVLRHRLGVRHNGRAMAGPSYWAKAALQAAWRRTSMARAAQQRERPIDFELRPGSPNGYIDTPAVYR